MKASLEENNKEFSIIFKEIEKYYAENPLFFDKLLTLDDIRNDKTIREFSEICQEISAATNVPVVYRTFT